MAEHSKPLAWSEIDPGVWRSDRYGVAYFVSGDGAQWGATKVWAVPEIGAAFLGHRSTRPRAIALCEQDAAEQAIGRAA